ncbi:MAG: large repetitive protein, partial [Methanomicrobiaceae archaeon]|nr:large repetitive protein [Methanomicrobiaceae archaeon]
YISGGVLSVPDVDTGSIDQIVVEFIGRALGDVNGGGVTAGDARDIAWYLVDEITFTYNDRFYADVGDDGSVSSGDARDVAWYLVGDIDTHYQ